MGQLNLEEIISLVFFHYGQDAFIQIKKNKLKKKIKKEKELELHFEPNPAPFGSGRRTFSIWISFSVCILLFASQHFFNTFKHAHIQTAWRN